MYKPNLKEHCTKVQYLLEYVVAIKSVWSNKSNYYFKSRLDEIYAITGISINVPYHRTFGQYSHNFLVFYAFPDNHAGYLNKPFKSYTGEYST